MSRWAGRTSKKGLCRVCEAFDGSRRRSLSRMRFRNGPGFRENGGGKAKNGPCVVG